MGPASILADLERTGLRLAAAGDRLVVAPASRITPDIRVAIRTHKEQLLAALAASAVRDQYEETAAIGEYDLRLERVDAERRAWDAALAMYMNSRTGPEPDGTDCPACRGKLVSGTVFLLRPDGGRTPVHADCVPGYLAQRRAEAVMALVAAGIPKPVGWRP